MLLFILSLQSDDVFSRRYHWHHYQSLFLSTRKRSAFFVMSFCYAARLKLCLLLINWGFVDPWKSLLAEIMCIFFLSLCREIIDINIPCDSISKIYIFPVIYAINLVLILIWHSVMVADDILATKFCARDIFDSFFFHAFIKEL